MLFTKRLKKKHPPKYLKKSNSRFSKWFCISILIFAIIFIATMVTIFCLTEDHRYPYELATPVLGFFGAEYGWLSWIKNTDTKSNANKEDTPKQDPDTYDGC